MYRAGRERGPRQQQEDEALMSHKWSTGLTRFPERRVIFWTQTERVKQTKKLQYSSFSV